ncbi:MAG: hypothetical protein AB9886_02065 [Candidatus Cryosericum sp.]
MSSSFVVRPDSVQVSAIVSNHVSLSPSGYRIIKKPLNTRRLSSLVKSCRKGREIGSDAYMPRSPYRFLKTGNINGSYILDDTKVEFCKPCKGAVKPQSGSILVAKDGGIPGLGECCLYETKNGTTDYISAGVLGVEFHTEQDRNYVLGVLKSLHFKEYIDVATPHASTIRHSKLLILDYDVPWSQNVDKRNAVSDLVADLLDKERLIAAKNTRIDALIDNELTSGLDSGADEASLTSRSELLTTTRLDAGMYADLVRKTDHRILHYRGGFYHIPERFKSARGQNLQVSSIGESYYSDTPKKGFYRLFTNIEMTDMRTIIGFRWLGNKRKLSTLPKNCVMLAADGTVGRSFFFDEMPNTITNIHPWIITAKDESQPRHQSVFLSLFISYLRNIGYLDKIMDKSNGGGLKKNHVEKWIKIPAFPDKIQQETARHYYNDARPLNDDSTLAQRKARNPDLGIFQLNMEVLALREHLSDAVRDIVLHG